MYVYVDASEVHDLAQDLTSAGSYVTERAPLAVSKTGHDMQGRAQELVPVDTGHLKSTISLTVTGLGFDLGPTAEYGGYVEEGTDGPYPIENAFGWGITVMHPGISPEPYLGPAFDQHLPNLERALGSLGAQAVLRAA